MLDTPPMLVELSVMEQRYQAVSLVIHDGESVVDVARRFGVSRQTVHSWLSRYEVKGLIGLTDRSRRPKGCAHQMPAEVEAVVLEMRRVNPGWVRVGCCMSWSGQVSSRCRHVRGCIGC